MTVEVDPHLLHAGATMALDGGRLIGDGADALSRAELPVGMFGDFSAAHGFHSTLSGHHTQNVALMRQHQSVLHATGEKAHTAARGFAQTDDSNAETIRAVGESAL